MRRDPVESSMSCLFPPSKSTVVFGICSQAAVPRPKRERQTIRTSALNFLLQSVNSRSDRVDDIDVTTIYSNTYSDERNHQSAIVCQDDEALLQVWQRQYCSGTLYVQPQAAGCRGTLSTLVGHVSACLWATGDGYRAVISL